MQLITDSILFYPKPSSSCKTHYQVHTHYSIYFRSKYILCDYLKNSYHTIELMDSSGVRVCAKAVDKLERGIATSPRHQ